MIEIKLSQGAKPGHGGLLTGPKVTKLIAEARGVEAGKDCNSPPLHSAFKDAPGLVRFIKTLREASGGKPVGFKLCVGKGEEFCSIVSAMIDADTYPDFITVDGAEGGTGAAPPEFSNSVGTPLREGLTLINSVLIGAGVRNQVKIICSGKVTSGFSIVKLIALGADLTNAARPMMFALGCIQAGKCNTNRCPSGVATQDPDLFYGLDVDSKAVRVATFQKKTVEVNKIDLLFDFLVFSLSFLSHHNSLLCFFRFFLFINEVCLGHRGGNGSRETIGHSGNRCVQAYLSR